MTGYGSAGSRWMTERLDNEQHMSQQPLAYRHPHYGADDDMDDQYNPSGESTIIKIHWKINLIINFNFNRQRRPDTAGIRQ